jgi:DUF1365 family protein
VTLRSALYDGQVVHERFQPKAHKLRYRVFSMLLDLDELPRLDASVRLFGYNGWAPLSFHDRDHGPRDGSALRPWAEATMRAAGIEPDGGRIELLCYPRILGYVFNPLSVYFCRRRDETLAAILYEVHNTHGEQHTYALVVTDQGGVIQQSAEKAFYVSPFLGPTATYDFRIVPPGDDISVVIRQKAEGKLLMVAAFHGTRKPFAAAGLARRLCLFPLMTFKVIAAIHWEALKMWCKGFAVFPHSPRGKLGTRP